MARTAELTNMGDEPIRLNTSSRLPASYLNAITERYGQGFRKGRFPEGVNLITQGAHGKDDDSLYVILDGEVDIVKSNSWGETRQARIGGPGTLVGEIRAGNLSIPRTRTVRVTEGGIVAITLYQEDIRTWNFEGRPWGNIHDFMTDLARTRVDSLSEDDRKAFGLDNLQWQGTPAKEKPPQANDIKEKPTKRPINIGEEMRARARESALLRRVHGANSTDPDHIADLISKIIDGRRR